MYAGVIGVDVDVADVDVASVMCAAVAIVVITHHGVAVVHGIDGVRVVYVVLGIGVGVVCVDLIIASLV